MADPLRLAAALAEIGIARYGSNRPGAALLLKFVGVVCAGLGGGFVVASVLIYLIPVIGAAEAALVVGSGLLVVGLVVAGIGPSMVHLAREAPENAQRPDLDALVADAEGFVRQNKSLVLAAAFVAGLLTADKPSDGRC
jgi:hypothetical protein